MTRIDGSAPWYVAERNLQRALDRAAAGQPLAEVAGSTVAIEDHERRFADVAEITRHLEWLSAQPAVVQLAGDRPPPEVRLDGRRRHAIHHLDTAGGGEIRLPDDDFGRRQLTVLHEHAHHLVPGGGHGPRFCGTLVLLIRTAIGPSAALMLTEQLALHDVPVTLP